MPCRGFVMTRGLALQNRVGVKMKRPDSEDGDLAGLSTQGAACWLTPDLRKWNRHLLPVIIHRNALDASVVSNGPTPSLVSPTACGQAPCRDFYGGRRLKSVHHGPSKHSAQRDTPGSAIRGGRQRLSEAGVGRPSSSGCVRMNALVIHFTGWGIRADGSRFPRIAAE